MHPTPPHVVRAPLQEPRPFPAVPLARNLSGAESQWWRQFSDLPRSPPLQHHDPPRPCLHLPRSPNSPLQHHDPPLPCLHLPRSPNSPKPEERHCEERNQLELSSTGSLLQPVHPPAPPGSNPVTPTGFPGSHRVPPPPGSDSPSSTGSPAPPPALGTRFPVPGFPAPKNFRCSF